MKKYLTLIEDAIRIKKNLFDVSEQQQLLEPRPLFYAHLTILFDELR